jgi:hypothetical protein
MHLELYRIIHERIRLIRDLFVLIRDKFVLNYPRLSALYQCSSVGYFE